MWVRIVFENWPSNFMISMHGPQIYRESSYYDSTYLMNSEKLSNKKLLGRKRSAFCFGYSISTCKAKIQQHNTCFVCVTQRSAGMLQCICVENYIKIFLSFSMCSRHWIIYAARERLWEVLISDDVACLSLPANYVTLFPTCRLPMALWKQHESLFYGLNFNLFDCLCYFIVCSNVIDVISEKED